MPHAVSHPAACLCPACRAEKDAELQRQGCADLTERYVRHGEQAIRYTWKRQGRAWGWDDGTVVALTPQIEEMLRTELAPPGDAVALRQQLADRQRAAEQVHMARAGEGVQDLLARLEVLQRKAQEPEQAARAGAYLERQRQEEQRRAWEQSEAGRRDLAAKAAGVPENTRTDLRQLDRTYRAELLDPESRSPCEIVAAWHKSKKPALLLHGGNQLGKSVAAAAWVAQRRGLWICAETGALDDAVRPDPDDHGRAQINAWKKTPALVIDGVQPDHGPAALKALEQIVQTKFEREQRLIVTMNGSWRGFFELFGDCPAALAELDTGVHNRILHRWVRLGQIEEVR